MTLDEIRRMVAGGRRPSLEVHAIDPMIYLVFECASDTLTPITDRNGQTLRYPSRFAALNALQQTGIPEVDFVHRSAYGEMVGLEDAGDSSEFRQRVRLTREDL